MNSSLNTKTSNSMPYTEAEENAGSIDAMLNGGTYEVRQ